VRESGEGKLETKPALRRRILSTGEEDCTGKISLRRKRPAFAEPASNAEDPAYNRITCRRSVSSLVAQANREPEASEMVPLKTIATVAQLEDFYSNARLLTPS
jgi:hypothetical protein